MESACFYCEQCGRKVSSNLASCPGCGQRFYLIRCPACGFTGEPEDFKKNCLVCGHGNFDTKNDKYAGVTIITTSGNDKNYTGKKKKFLLPVYFYKVFIGVLIIVLLILIRVLLLM